MQRSPKSSSFSPSNTFSPPSPTFNPPLRYSSDFTELDVLGKGAYGEVFKVENKLDGCTYAIKKIQLEDDEVANRRILREVSALSRLTHKYIVRYYQSWIEAGWTYNNLRTRIPQQSEESSIVECINPPESQENSDFQIPQISWDSLGKRVDDDSSMDVLQFDYSGTPQEPIPEVILKKKKPKKEKKQVQLKHSFSDSFNTGTLICNVCSNRYSDWEVSFEDWKLIEVKLQPLNLCEDCYKEQIVKQTGIQIDSIQIRRKTFGPSYLYIQIQYCDHTLRELMDDGSLWLIWKEDEIWVLFKQIIEALEYLHQQKYIHRDLKPSNIFLLNGSVKLGDFGLATCGAEREISIESLLYESNSTDRTYNVGTYLYASPEISKGSYTEKVDMYSAGIILFELWHPFKTSMERYKNIESLRTTKKLPFTFVERYSKQSDLILRLIDDDQNRRPSASTVLKEIPSKMNSSKSVRGFGAHLARVSMENNRLVEQQNEMQEKIKQLEQRLAQLENENRVLRELQSKNTIVQ